MDFKQLKFALQGRLFMKKKFDSVQFQRKKRTALSKKLINKQPVDIIRFFNSTISAKTSKIGKAA